MTNEEIRTLVRRAQNLAATCPPLMIEASMFCRGCARLKSDASGGLKRMAVLVEIFDHQPIRRGFVL